MRGTSDRLVGLLLWVGAAAYVVSFPHNLGNADEAAFLYESKRVLEGDVFYRDIFNIITPASRYMMALFFHIFGTSMTTARAVLAAFHGLTTAFTYATCRAMGVRPGLSIATALAFIFACQPAWPHASAHWISTALGTVLLFVLIRRPWRHRATLAAVPGLLVGLLLMVQQHRGVVLAVGVGCVLIGQHVIERRFGSTLGWRALGVEVAWLVAGAALVVVPALSLILATAGFAPVYRALVHHPLANYPEVNRPLPWGKVSILTVQLSRHTFPLLLKYLPAVLVVDAARTLRLWWGRENPERTGALAVLMLFGGFSALSIMYHSDFIHVAFVSPVFLIAGAEVVQRALDWLCGRRFLRFAAPLVVAGLLVGLCYQGYRTQARMHRQYSIPFETAFGRIDFANRLQIALVEEIEKLVQKSGNREIFCYPACASVYLMTGTANPTRYQMLHVSYNDRDQIHEVIDTIAAREVPLAIFVPIKPVEDDPVREYIGTNYQQSEEVPLLWRRKRR